MEVFYLLYVVCAVGGAEPSDCYAGTSARFYYTEEDCQLDAVTGLLPWANENNMDIIDVECRSFVVGAPA